MAARKKRPGPRETRRIQLLREVLEGRMPGDQAEKAAQFMWSTWGSLKNILSAPEEAIASAPGMDPDTARHLRLTLELARACLDEETDSVKRVGDRRTAVELFQPLFLGQRVEAVGAVLLDTGSRVIYRGIVCEGAVNAVPLYVRRLVRLCIDYDADSFILAHNHISGSAEPSKQDILTTKHLVLALDCIQVRLKDHIILTDGGYFSFSESGILHAMADDALAQWRSGIAGTRELTDYLAKEIGRAHV